MIDIDIPGGKATLRNHASEVSPRQRRETELIGAQLGNVVTAVRLAGRVLCEGNLVEDRSKEKIKDGPNKGKRAYPGPDINLTRRQLRLLSELNDAIVWSLLAKWTIKEPLPATPDDLLDIPGDVYDALRVAAAKVYMGIDPSGGFGPGALPEPGSDAEPDTSLPTSA